MQFTVTIPISTLQCNKILICIVRIHIRYIPIHTIHTILLHIDQNIQTVQLFIANLRDRMPLLELLVLVVVAVIAVVANRIYTHTVTDIYLL